MTSFSPSIYDPYNQISYLELNKHTYGEIERDESERIENRTMRPDVRKLYLLKNGDNSRKKPKLFIWRKWKSPTLGLLLEEAGSFMGVPEARALYTTKGQVVRDESEVRNGDVFVVAADDDFELFEQDWQNTVSRRNIRSANNYEVKKPVTARKTDRRSSWTSVATEDLIDFDYDNPGVSARNGKSRKEAFYEQEYGELPRPVSGETRSVYKSFSDHDVGTQPTYRVYDYENDEPGREFPKTPAPKNMVRSLSTKKKKPKSAGYSVHDGLPYDEPRRRHSVDDPDMTRSDFDHPELLLKDQHALAKHKEMMSTWRRTKSGIIYNRRDQTHPDAYIIYVFLNGQGMTCQYVNFQKKQLEKGMPYVLELIARRFNVNPGKLCNMDGKKMHEVQNLMSRGSYVLVPVGQSFRDQWYFLPDNAIDTSTNKDKVRERSAQRDRYLQRQEKKVIKVKPKKQKQNFTKNNKPKSKSVDAVRRGIVKY